MAQNLIARTDKAQVVEREPKVLSDKVVEELVGLIQRAGREEAAEIRSEPGYWSYRVPFPGVRYYSYD